MASVSLNEPPQHMSDSLDVVFTTTRPVHSPARRGRRRAPRIATEKLLDLAADPILLCDPATRKVVCGNRRACRLLGLSRSQLNGRELAEVTRGVGARGPLELRTSRHNGERWHWQGFVVTSGGREVSVKGTVRQLSSETGERLVSINLRTLAATADNVQKIPTSPDELTGLPTRRALRQHVERLLQRNRTAHPNFAVLFADLNGFKQVNDSFGHQAGDAVLTCVSKRLLDCMRPRDFVARYGGDEFVIVVSGVKRHGAVRRIIDRIHEAMNPPINNADWSVTVSLSIGACVCSAATATYDSLIEGADRAMYRQKAGLIQQPTPAATR